MYQAIAAMAQFGGEVYGGYRANSEARKQSKAVIAESELQAHYMKQDVDKLLAEQEVQYTKSGVILEGSPLLLLEETRKKGLEDRNNLRAAARERAAAISREGKNKLIGAITGGLGKFGGMAGMGGGGGGGGGAGGYSGSTQAGGSYTNMGNVA